MEKASVRFSVSFCLILLAVVGPRPGTSVAHGSGISVKHHPWGCCQPGAWRQVRIVKEKFDEKGLVASASLIKKRTTLLGVGKDGVTLQDDVVHEMSGKLFPRDPEKFKEGFHGQLVSQALKTTEAGTGHVVIEGRKIACQILQLELSGPASKTVTKIYYSATVAPYVLKRRIVTTDLAGKNPPDETTIDVVALDMPCKVLVDIQTAAYVRSVRKYSKGTTTTWAATSTQMPGGVIWHASKELDTNGRLIRRSTLELVDYGLEPEPKRTGLISRPRRGIFRNLPLRPSP